MKCAQSPDTFRCPTKWELFSQTMALLPHGRAWQNREDVGIGNDIDPANPPVPEQLSVLQQYWASWSEELAFFHERVCRLLREFFCSSVSETRDGWEHEFAFPDDCLPYESLCAKVTAIGGNRCVDLVDMAARLGWVIECQDCNGAPLSPPRAGCGAQVGCGSRLGCGASGCDAQLLTINIVENLSPSFYGRQRTRVGCGNRAGCGARVGCATAPASLTCLFDRLKPAHVAVRFAFVQRPDPSCESLPIELEYELCA